MEDSIPIHRDTLKHWIYCDSDYFKIWVTMLARARYMEEPKTVVYEKTLCTVNYGEFIFGYKAWSESTGISYQRLRTLIKKLIKEKMIFCRTTTNHFSIYQIINYRKFNSQSNSQPNSVDIGVAGIANSQDNSQLTVSQQSANSQLTTNKEGNKKEKKDKEIKYKYGELENVLLTEKEYGNLIKKYGEETAINAIDFLGAYIVEKKYKTESHNLTIQRWVIEAVNKKQPQQQKNGIIWPAPTQPKANEFCKECNGTGHIIRYVDAGSGNMEVKIKCKCVR
ncbi:MAG TPA: hypothetical protein VGL27_18950 [Negativicutes bacterium]|jgi:hypothetical protein